MRYSTEAKDRLYVIGYRFLSFAKNIDKNSGNKYSQTFLGSAKKSAKDATGDFTGNKIADKIIKASSQNSDNTELNKEIAKERFISPEIYIQKEDSKLVITKINIIIS